MFADYDPGRQHHSKSPHECEFPMNDEPKKPETRSLFRLLAGISCPFFFFAAIATAFPHLLGGNGESSVVLAVLLLWGGVLFASIAATGRLRK